MRAEGDGGETGIGMQNKKIVLNKQINRYIDKLLFKRLLQNTVVAIL